MRILYISNAEIPSHVTHSLSIMRMCQAFVDTGHEVVLGGVLPTRNQADPIAHYGLRGGFRVYRYYVGRLRNSKLARGAQVVGLLLAWKFRALVLSSEPDIVYSRLTLAELLFVPRRYPIVYETHSLGPLGTSPLHRLLFSTLIRTGRIRRIIVTTEQLRRTMTRRFPKTSVVLARLSAEKPRRIPTDELKRFRQRVLVERAARVNVGYTGYIDTDGLRGIQIICDLARDLPEMSFHIVGGPQAAVRYWKRYLSKSGGVHNLFFYGFRPPDEIPYFLSVFDVVLAPLQFRPTKRAPIGKGMSPLKISQYLAHKKPIVASDIPAHRELLENGKTALLVQPGDLKDWANTLKLVVADNELQTYMGEHAYRFFLRELTPEERVKKVLLDLY